MTHTAFDVYLYGAWIERVYYSEGHSADAVRHMLVQEEGYPVQITVHLAARKTA